MTFAVRFCYAAAFQLGWFLCVTEGDVLSSIYTLLFCIGYWHFQQPRSAHKELAWFALMVTSGFLLESLFLSAGFLQGQPPGSEFYHLQFPPLWLLNLWLLFAVALRTCLSFLFKEPWLAFVGIAVFTPLNYAAGSHLSRDIEISQPYALSLSFITLAWLAFWWCLLHIKQHYFEDIFHA